jgi:NADPH-dependent 2,4-dienoyl-CoA reductase/sulfur reductase-like enzyme
VAVKYYSLGLTIPKTMAQSTIPAMTNETGAGELPHVETDLLIIGAGPAGASLACFLAQHGETSTV